MIRLSHYFCAALTLCSSFFALAAFGTVRFVDLNSTNPVAPYTSSATAASTIQDAVDVANSGDQILVYPGAYQTGGRSVDGATTNRLVINQAVTVQSLNGPAVTIIDGGGVMRCAYVTNGAALIGFTLTNGFGSAYGGGVLGTNNSFVSGCVIIACTATYGGGLFEGTASNCVITSCGILGNASGGGSGGGGASSAVLLNCLIEGNVGFSGGGADNSTLVGCEVISNTTINLAGGLDNSAATYCKISGNTTLGLQAYAPGGGGAVNSTLRDCIISGNIAQPYGGGIATGTALACTFTGNTVNGSGGGGWAAYLYNCIISENSATGGGGSYGCIIENSLLSENVASTDGGGDISSSMQSSTVVSNHCESGGAGGGDGSSALNCIIYFNTSSNNTPYNGTNTSYSYCCTTPMAPGTGNITNAPLFQSDGFHLAASSPCRGVGTTTDSYLPADIDGLPRLSPPSMGCAEYYTNTGPTVAIQASRTNGAVGSSLNFHAFVTGGQAAYLLWNFGDNSADGAGLTTSHGWMAPGDYVVLVTAFFTNTPITATARIGIHVDTNQPVTECLTPPPGLVAWWRGEGDFTDAVDGNDGVGQNVSFATGMVGDAFIFADGTSSISVPASPALNVGVSTGLSVECWIQPDAFALAGTGAPILEWDTGTTNLVSFWAGNTLLGSIVDGSGISHTIQSSPGLLETIYWQHVAFTYDVASGAADLYLNGDLVASNNFGSVTPQTGGTVNIGWSAASSNDFGGLMDEVSLYDRALSPAEVMSLFNAAQEGKCDVPIAPTLVLQPQNTSLLPGASSQLNVIAAGTSPFSYQWTLNGNPINGATNTSLLLSNAACAQDGNIYAVAVTNEAGFVISSNAVLSIINTSPQISGMPDQVVSNYAPYVTLSFVVSDPGLPSSSVVVSGVSSNTSLVPNGQIVFGGADSNRTVTVTANSNVFGTTMISITATGPCGAGNQTSFIFSVTNFPPQISGILAQTEPLNVPVGPISFTVSDFETPADQLIVTAQSSNNSIVPTNQIVFGGSGTNRTLSIMPGTNTAGTATVTLIVTDALGASTSTSFTVRLNQFTLNAAFGFPAVQLGASAWGDYDNDGGLDLLITGTTNNGGFASNAITRIYHNDGGVFTNFISLPGISRSSVAWCDYDRDGFLDFAVSGINSSNVPVTLIYHNNGDGTFTDISAGLVGAYSGSVSWGDFNNDGLPDLIVTGLTNITKLYRNNGDGTFTDIKANLPGISFGSAVWGDFDNNGTVDLLLVGDQDESPGFATNRIAGIYRNLGNGVFTNSWNSFNPNLSSLTVNSALAVDLNNDGWLDVVFSGTSTFVYQNNKNGTFTLAATLSAGSLVAGDFENDGYPDLVVGASPSHFYHNNHNGTFTDTGAVLSSGSVAAGDFNNDGKLDLFFTGGPNPTLWQNDNYISDTAPVPPASLAAVNLQSNSVALSWSASKDSQTSSNGVSYNLRVGTTPGGIDVAPPLADPVSGQRRVAAPGNAGLTNQALLIDLPRGTYYWSVQAIDAAFESSAFAAEGTFVISNSRPSISTITDQTVAPLSTLAIPFSVEDADNAPAQLTIAVQSSNTNVVPITNIVLSVPNPAFSSNYVARITPVTNGTLVITITVSSPQGGFASTSFGLTAAQFTLLNTGFVQIRNSFIACGDFDNDGRLDFLVAGNTNGNAAYPITKLYRNLGGGVFAPVITGLPNVDYGSVAWGDFDNSGNLGLILTGTTNGGASGAITRIYRNNGGVFTDIGATLPPVANSAVAWGDFDNDGRLDLLITGSTNGSPNGPTAQIFRNMGNGTFSNAFTFPGVYQGAVAMADFDGDGFLDVLIAGSDSNGVVTTVIYKNNGGKSFTPAATLIGVADCSVSIGDFDHDGRPDILLSGGNGTGGSVTRVYQNNGNFNFTDIGAGLPGALYGSAAWGDVDNDGLLDVLVCGEQLTTARVYRNSGSSALSQSFTNYLLYSSPLPTNYFGMASWGDFENRGVLDVLSSGADGSGNPKTFLFRNNCAISNTPPSAPTGLSFIRSNTTVMLTWNQSTDLQTSNSSGLNYQVRIGSTPGGVDIKSPPADPVTGHRRVVQTGDTFTTGWNISGLAPGTYYWSVQAIDTGFEGSPFAAESTFTVLPPPIAIPDAFFTPSNTPATFPAANLTTNDIDPSALPLTVIAVGTNSMSGGVVSLNSGTVTYTPAANFGGNDTFWYSISDGQSAPAFGVVTATVGTGGTVWLKVLSGPLVDSNGNFVIRFGGVPGLTYTIEGAANVTGPWTKVTNLTAPQTDEGFGAGGFQFSQPAGGSAQFYRVIYPAY